MTDEKSLYAIAIGQGGLFTAKQAEECGYSQKNHHYRVKKREWAKEARGIYRLANIPTDETTIYNLLLLWSRNQADTPELVFSHETALSFHGLSDVNPSEATATVPKRFRKSTKPPVRIELYKSDLTAQDITNHNGLPVTTPLRTLLDIVRENTLSGELIEQAVLGARKKGMIRRSDLQQHPELAKYAV